MFAAPSAWLLPALVGGAVVLLLVIVLATRRARRTGALL